MLHQARAANALNLTIILEQHIAYGRTHHKDYYYSTVLVFKNLKTSFTAWEVGVTRNQEHEEVKMLSQITATFSVGLCTKPEGSPVCQTADTHSVHVVGIIPLLEKISLL